MSVLKSALIAGAIILAFAAPTFAQDAGIKEGNAYYVDKQGKVRAVPMDDKTFLELQTHSVKVPNGRVFYLHNGEFHHAEGEGVIFDRAGNPKASGK